MKKLLFLLITLLCTTSPTLPSKTPSYSHQCLSTIENALATRDYGSLLVLFNNLPDLTVKRTLTHIWSTAFLINARGREDKTGAKQILEAFGQQAFKDLLTKRKIDDSWLRGAYKPGFSIASEEASTALEALALNQLKQDHEHQVHKNLITLQKMGLKHDVEFKYAL